MSKKQAIVIIAIFWIITTFIPTILHFLDRNDEYVKVILVEDKTPPILKLKYDKLVVYEEDIIDYDSLILEAFDDIDHDVTSFVKHNEIDTSITGNYVLEYKVEDNSGNEAITSMEIIIREKLEM